MSSDVEICNRALSRAGTRGEVSSLDEGSPESIQCQRFYSSTVLEMLRDYRPKFAQRQILLADLGTPVTPWQYRYAEPSDLVIATQLIPNVVRTQKLPYLTFLSTGSDDAQQNPIRVILANEPQARLIYITNRVATSPNVWDDGFTQAIEASLASKIAIPLTGDKTIAANAYQVAQLAVAQARMEDGNENVVIINNMPDWIQERGYTQMLPDWMFR